MLFVFHVDTGTIITFDIKFALQPVSQLKDAIERECGVVAAHQVLLMSGGESLEPNSRVCSYSAGTDTNPIYLFSKAAIESQIPPTPSIDYGSDVDLQSQVDASLAMPATYQTLVARAQLAQQCCGLARAQTRICERLVHDQHLQQQGWAAVVANLEEITQTFESRASQFQHTFGFYLNERQQHMELLNRFSEDLGTLAKIPILPALRAYAEGFLVPDDEQEMSQRESQNNEEVLSLLRWISAKDNQSSLEQVAEQCSRGLEQFDERMMEAVKSEVNMAIDAANKQDMKEIKGLGERLFALEQLMQQTKRLVQEQGELAQGFVQNQNRANNLGDPSVLPDLCMSHRRQLLVMLQNHNQLRDIRRRCTKAKEELSVNIYHRLKWIMYVENKMMEVDSKIIMYNESLRRLRRHLEVIQQIHLAPQMYVSAVAEVVRRRTFSQAFLVWASNLACQLLTVHTEEIERRREFESKFDGHFLNTLFPGLEDAPPPFATQAPPVFDNALPKLTVDDMESLKTLLPSLDLTISTPDLNSITQFFLSKSLTEASSDGNKEKDSISMPVDVPTKELVCAKVPMLTDRGGFESETDTEEFEKISQGAGDSKPGSLDGAKQRRQKQLEVGASRSVSPASSTSTNVSPLTSKVGNIMTRSSSSSSEPGSSFHLPGISASEKTTQLSPLAECIENGDAPSHAHSSGHRDCRKCRENIPTGIASTSAMTEEESSSQSPNPSSFTRSFSSSSGGPGSFQIPASSSEKPSVQLSPLAECIENGKAGGFHPHCTAANCSANCCRVQIPACAFTATLQEETTMAVSENSPAPYPQSYSPNSTSMTRSPMCDGQQNQQQHRRLSGSGGSSPSAGGVGANDFMGTEYYMDESLPSSLSEHPTDDHHQAIVSLLQENLGTTREEVERLRKILRTMKTVVCETLVSVKQELAVLKDSYAVDKNGIHETVEQVQQSLNLYSRMCNQCLREREQTLTLDHEIELYNVKEQLKRHEEEAETMKQSLLKKEMELEERNHLLSKIRQKMDDEQSEMRNIQSHMRQQLSEALDQARIDKETAVKETNDERFAEIASLTSSLTQCQKRIQELEESLSTARNEQQRMVKEVADKLQIDYKTELETIRSRFKLMAASTMERSPSDSSLEKIERPDVIEIANHEAILAQTKEDMKLEKSEAIRTAVAKERADCIAKLNEELQLARQMVEEKNEEIETHRIREVTLVEECQRYKDTIRQFTETEDIVRDALSEKVEASRVWLENKIKQQEKEKFSERLDMSQSDLEEEVKSTGSEKDEAEASESKKVRLETDDDLTNLMMRLEILENDNKRLNTELQAARERKDMAEAKVEALKTEKADLVSRLRKASVITPIEETSPRTLKKREKEMSTSVAVITESTARDVASCSGVIQRSPSVGCFHSSSHIRKKLMKSVAKLVQQGPITVSTCNPGDLVLVLWDPLHKNYTLYQESATLYFLNSDCISALGLGLNIDGTPKRSQTVALVIDKEYCHARKAENRYHVPQGTKFYRVRVRSVDKHVEATLLTKSQQQ